MNIVIFKKNLKRIRNASLTAVFAVAFGLTAISTLMAYALITYTLTVSKYGTGANNGTVTSSPAGIDCGVNCSNDFNDGEMITLTASTPVGGLTTFTGWGGECNGTGDCTVTMDAAKNVIASFNDSVVYQKCTLENPTTWGLRYRLTGASNTVAACQAKCLAGGGNGNLAINAQLGWCLCGTERQPTSTAPPTIDCNNSCPGTIYSCGGTQGQFSVYGVQVPTAATVSVSGYVTSSLGRGITGIQLSLTDSEGNTKTTTTAFYGYYRFDNIQAGETYTLQASGKHYSFSQPVQVLNIQEQTDQVNFIANPEKRIRGF